MRLFSRIARRSEHSHQALGRDVPALNKTGESDRGVRWHNHANCGSCFALPTGLYRNRGRTRDDSCEMIQ
jgi:hypothetical protein